MDGPVGGVGRVDAGGQQAFQVADVLDGVAQRLHFAHLVALGAGRRCTRRVRRDKSINYATVSIDKNPFFGRPPWPATWSGSHQGLCGP